MAILSVDTFRPPLNRVRRRHRNARRVVAALGVAAVLAALGWGGVAYARWCGKGSHSVRLGGECIGLSDGAYDFGNPQLAGVGDKIHTENELVARTDPNYVRIAVLSPMTTTAQSPMKDTEVLHSVQGAYIAQYRANHNPPKGIGKVPRIQLVLANMGSQETHWRTAVDAIEDELGGDHPIVGVVGLGVSLKETRDAAVELSRKHMPMVGGALSGDGLDAGSIPGLLNVSPGNRHYVAALAAYLGQHPELDRAMLVADAKDDLYTSTLAEDFATTFDPILDSPSQFQGSLPGAPPPVFEFIVQDICTYKPQLVFFAGRSRDRDTFIDALARRRCKDVKLVVVTGATGLSSSSLTPQARASGVSMLYSTSDDTRQWSASESGRPSGFGEFKDAFSARFGDGALDDGYAVMFHDATLTMAEALRLALAPDLVNRASPQRDQVRIQLLNLHGQDRAVEGASGTLSFSSDNGGRAGGKPVPVLQTMPDGTVQQVKLNGEVYRTPD